MEPSYDFISYAREDREYIDGLVKALKAAGIGVRADHDIDYGDRWADVVRDRIDGCAAVLVVMSPAAGGSSWVAREIAWAEQQSKKILPLLLTGTAFFRLVDLHYEDVRGGRPPGAALIRRLRELAGHLSYHAEPLSERSPSLASEAIRGVSENEHDSSRVDVVAGPTFFQTWVLNRSLDDMAGDSTP
jgi:hypothetical protein